jgi:alpha,alpha-trehalase
MLRASGGRVSWVTAAALGGLLLIGAAPAAVGLQLPPSPHEIFGELFERVQLAGVFPDGKDFADAVPKYPPAEILTRFQAAQPRTLEELRRFVDETFTPPQNAATPAAATGGAAGSAAGAAQPAATPVPLTAHIDALWDVLTRQPGPSVPYSSLLPLPRPFVVPGGRFREIYYWDSYFTMLGLLTSGRRDLTQDMVSNFAYLLDSFGRIPNGNRTYYLSRSQPPFFFAMVALLSPQHPERAWARYLQQLKREHEFWMDGAAGVAPGNAVRRVVALAPGMVLNRYWDDDDQPRDEAYRHDLELSQSTQRKPAELFRDVRAAAESGWDFSSRWLSDGQSLNTIVTTTIVPVDLNSLLFGLERAIAAGCAQQGDQACAQDFSAQATARRRAMNRYLWVAARGVYLDYDWPHGRSNPGLSAATFYPLFTHAASPSQADAVAKNAAPLLMPGGLVTTPRNSGQQWDAPNGWAPLQWVAISGLRGYGNAALAGQIACRWLVNVTHVYEQTGKLVEKYDVVDPGRPGGGGEYPTQDGFGWTNGVTRKLLALYPREAAYRNLSQCPVAQVAAAAAR